jgi:uncharacterized protein (TIGR01777 family)
VRGLPDAVRPIGWDGVTPPAPALEGAGAVIHLAGEPVFGGLPTAARLARVRASRVDSTRALVTALAAQPQGARPRTLISASAVGFYGDRGEEVLTEASAPGSGFLAQLCIDWEEAAAGATPLGVRVVALRIGIVLAREGGALPGMAQPVRLGAGIRLGDGRQWVPWIHVDDLVAMIASALVHDAWSGPVNAVAPHPVRNLALTEAIAARLRRPLPLDRLLGARAATASFVSRALHLALGETANEVLGSKRVVPQRANALGFEFAHPKLESALAAEL